MKEAVLRVARHSSIYSLRTSVSFLTSLAAFPLYAAYLAPSDLGAVTLVRVVISVGQTFAGMGLYSGMFRYLSDAHAQRDEERVRLVVWTAVAGTLAGGCAVTLAFLLLGPALAGRSIGSRWVLGFELEAATILLSAPSNLAGYALRAVERAVANTVIFVAGLLINLALTVVFLVFLHAGAYGLFWADFVAAAVVCPAGIVLLMPFLGRPVFSRAELKRIARFGVPSVASQVGEFIVTFSDRFFLTMLRGLGQVGVYSLGYRLGTVEQQVAVGGLQLAWDPFVLQNLKREDAERLFGVTATYMLLLAMIPVILLGSLSPTLLLLIHAQKAYLGASPIVFLIALSYWFGFARYLFITPTFVKIKPELGVLVLLGTGLLNFALNFPLIRSFGMMGAAWATLISYLVGTLAGVVVGIRLWKIHFEFGRVAIILVSGCVCWIVLSRFQLTPLLLDLALKCLVGPLMFLALLTVANFWRSEEKLYLLQRIRALRSSSPSAPA